MDENKLRIGAVAKQAGLRKSAIRYYESIGLLAEPERSSGQRLYDESVLRRLSLIDVAQRAGLSLSEIRDLLEVGNEPASERLRQIATSKLPEVESLIRRAEAMRLWLKAAEECSCEAIDDCALFDPDGLVQTANLEASAARSQPETQRAPVDWSASRSSMGGTTKRAERKNDAVR